MVHARTLALAGLCALTAPAAAFAQHASAPPRTRGGGPPMAAPAWVTFPIDTSVRESVGDGCLYEASARGSYRAPPGGNVPDREVRDADIQGVSRLTCNGQEVRHGEARIVSDLSSTDVIGQMVRDQLAVEVPSTGCRVAPTVILGGSALPGQASNNCAARTSPDARGGGPRGGFWTFDQVERRIAADRADIVAAHRPGAAPMARGGGPVPYGARAVTSEDARLGVR